MVAGGEGADCGVRDPRWIRTQLHLRWRARRGIPASQPREHVLHACERDHAGCIEESVHLVDDLLDIERDLDSLFDIAGHCEGLRRLGDVGSPLKVSPHLREIGLGRDFDNMQLHVPSALHMLAAREKSSGR
jgi:hypothetical protein